MKGLFWPLLATLTAAAAGAVLGWSAGRRAGATGPAVTASRPRGTRERPVSEGADPPSGNGDLASRTH